VSQAVEARARGGDWVQQVATVITRLEGGAGMLALRGAMTLDADAFGLTLVTGRGSPRLLDQARAAGLRVVIEPSLQPEIDPLHDALAARRLHALLRRGQFDVVHTHTAKAGVLGRMAAHRAEVPWIVHTYHGFPFHEFQWRSRRAAYVAIERRLGRITDLALCVGTGVAVEAVRRGLVSPERIRTIGVAVENDGGAALRATASSNAWPRNGSSPREAARRRLEIPPDATVVGAVGRLTYQKAPEDFVEMLRRLGRSGVVGVWVGDGELAETMRRRAAADPAVRIILAGERADVPELLPAFDVFALPSRYEGLPTAVVEAMVCGIPVVATAVNSVSDVVIPGETGLLVPPGRPDLMAAAVEYLLDSPATAMRMAGAARTRLGDRYSLTALRSALIEAYRGSRAQSGPAQRNPIDTLSP
jgi:glycosyltransferase involved in cell wall biosynthesis